jgi:rhamnosyltransferase
MNVAIIIPTYNGGALWEISAAALDKHAKEHVDYILAIDSSSKDNTAEISKSHGFEVYVIDSKNFNHGGTRNYAASMVDSEILIFLTQDAIIQQNAISAIVDRFKSDPDIAVVYGRQLPHDDANEIASHARIFNYPDQSHIYEYKDKKEKGIKAVFTSNSFCAYRRDCFKKIGGFSKNTILSEDMLFASHAIKGGYKIAYEANAAVKHSHNYSAIEEFKRYFDIGVFHCTESWIRSEFGGAGGEGKRFIISELKYLLKRSPLLIPKACIQNLFKIVGYKCGKNHKAIPKVIKVKLSMHKAFWK